MTNQPRNPQRRRNPALRLIWALPLALIGSYAMLALAELNWCGLFGCSGGGFGRISDPNVPAAVSFLIATGVVAALPLVVIRWSRKSWMRWLVASGVAAVVCYIGYALISP